VDPQDREAREAEKKAKREAMWLKRYRRGRRIAPFATGLVFSGCIVLAVTIAAPAGIALLVIAAAALVLSLANELRSEPSPALMAAEFVPVGLGLTVLPWTMFPGAWGYLVAALGLAFLLYTMGQWLKRLPELYRARPDARPFRVVCWTVAGLVMGGGLTGFLFLDEPKRQFPQLEGARNEPAPEQNGWQAFRDFPDDPRWSERGRSEVSDLFDAVRDADDTWSPQLARRVAEMLERWAQPLAAIDQAVERPRFALPTPRSWQEAKDASEDPWDNLQHTLRNLLALRSQLAEREGRPADAAADAVRLIRMGALIMSDAADTIDYLVGAVWLQTGMGRARELAGALDVEQIGAVASVLPPEAVLGESLRLALAGEFATTRMMVESCNDLTFFAEGKSEFASYSETRMALLIRRPAQMLVKANATLNAVGEACEAVLRSTDSYSAAQRLDYEGYWESLTERPDWFGLSRNIMGSLIVMWNAPGPRMAEHYFRFVGDLRLTRVTLALAGYRLAEGTLPDTLGALAPEFLDGVPVDPFTEKPFIYEPDGDPPRLLSVRPDQQLDAEGEADPERDDIVVELDFTATASAKHGDTEITEDDGDR
jgi:hypothetical protein